MSGSFSCRQAFRQGARLQPQVSPPSCAVVDSHCGSGQATDHDTKGAPRQADIAQWFSQPKLTKAATETDATVRASGTAADSQTDQRGTPAASSGRAGPTRVGDPDGQKLRKPAARTTAQQKLTLFASCSLDQATKDQ